MSNAILTKRCYRCKKIKPLKEFCKRKSTKDGFDWCCKKCKKDAVTKYLQTENGKIVTKHYRQSVNGKKSHDKFRKSKRGKEIDRQAGMRYKKTDKGKKSVRICARRYYLGNPEKVVARRAVSHAVASGSLPRVDSLQCYYCPEQAKQYHHWRGYAPECWLDVIPVCVPCHKIAI